MSQITYSNRLLSQTSLFKDQQLKNKRFNLDESNKVSKKKFKHSIDVTLHWKKIEATYKTNTTKIFECKSKNDYLIINDLINSDRSRFIISKSSYYWLNESIRLMQQHIEYGTTFDAAMMGEIIEIERNLKALKLNVEKSHIEKTFFYRSEALLNFIRLCCTFFDNPLEKFHRRLHALFNVCASCWLHMFDIMLPISIIRVEKSFILDDDHEDFVNDSILRHYLKNDQKKIKKANNELPNIRHILYSILLIIEKLDELFLIDQIYLERFQIIYDIWVLIDNELNSCEKKSMIRNSKKINKNNTEKISWNFIGECNKYEKMFGAFTSNVK